MTLLIMVISLLLLLALRVPVSIALLIPSLGYVVMDPSVRLGTAVQQTSTQRRKTPSAVLVMFGANTKNPQNSVIIQNV